MPSNRFLKYFMILAISTIWMFPEAAISQVYKISGGPSGGTFQYYAQAIQNLAKKSNLKILAMSSNGSIENIRLVNSGSSGFGIAYSAHVYDAKEGKLKNDKSKYDDVMAVAYLYGAPAQLVVKKKAGITHPKELLDKRVGVGNVGSGAAENAEIYFSEIGIWDKMGRENLGYLEADEAFVNGQLDAFWVFAGFPNASVSDAASKTDIMLLNTYNAGEEAGLFKKYPYFTKVIIPADTYQGQSEDVITFQDTAILVVNKKVSDDDVYKLLLNIFNKEGLEYMVKAHVSATAMSTENGIKGIVTPLHPGAKKFWKEKGVLK
ncbi:MAG: TAXI family TRAP transporter solute-binding subunit [Calditrichaceae bacterium]